MTENVVPFEAPKPVPSQHLPRLAVQLAPDGSVTSVVNHDEHDETAFKTEITPIIDGRFYVSMLTPQKMRLLWIIERFGIIRPATPIECKMWFHQKSVAPDPVEAELRQVSQTLLLASRNGISDTALFSSLMGYAAELCERMAARMQGQRMPTFSETPQIMPEPPEAA